MITNGSGSEFQIVGAANENDLQPYFFSFADGIVKSLSEPAYMEVGDPR